MSTRTPGMNALAAVAVCGALWPVAVGRAQPGPHTEQMRLPGAGVVTAYVPAGPPQQVVLFLSGDGGWNLGVVPMAERLTREGALVVGIDVREFAKTLNASKSCAYPAGVLEEVSRAVQARLKLPEYVRPIVAGYSSGATLAYAAIAAAPQETFAGAISLGFCPDVELQVPLCQMRGLRSTKRAKGVSYDLAPFGSLAVPWMVLQGEQDQVCAPAQTRTFTAATGSTRLFALPKVGHGFGVPANWEPAYVQAFRELGTAAAREVPRASAPAVADLSLVEVPATGTRVNDTLAVFLSGDGGWAELDKAVAAGLAAEGIPVVGWSSLDYYWSPRTPERASADLARILEHYTAAWRRSRVILVGYSFGANVVPFLVNGLDERARSHLASAVLLAPSDYASFEFHVGDWIGARDDTRFPLRPAMDALAVTTVCVMPADEPERACDTPNPRVSHASASAGHHFGGDYDSLARLIAQASR